jgi:hypothetical protein
MIADHVSTLSQALSELEQFSVPYVGSFIRQVQQARIDPQKNVVFPPYETLIFVPYTSQYTHHLVEWIQKNRSVQGQTAHQLVEQLGTETFEYLQQFKNLAIPEWGTLKFDENNLICFERDASWQWKWSEIPLIERTTELKQVKTVDEIKEVPFTVPEKTPEPAPVEQQIRKAQDIPPQPNILVQNRAVSNTKVIVIGLLIISATIALFFFRNQINEMLGIETASKHKLVIPKSEDEMLIEAIEGDSMIDVAPVSKDSIDHKVRQADQNHFKNPTIYHIIVGVADGQHQADSLKKVWIEKGFEVEALPADKKDRFRISVFKSDHLNTTDRKLAELKLHSKIPYDTWVLKVKNPNFKGG